jgi:hypothetical protein
MSYEGPNLGLETGFVTDQDGWGEPYNEAMRRLDALTDRVALDVVEDLPGSPADGDRYLLSAAASENANKFAVRVEGAWSYYAPPLIQTIFVKSLGFWVRWESGAWVDQGVPAHGHSIVAITGLTVALAGKSDTGHGHAISDVTGLTAALAGKSDTGHGHAISDVTGLTAALAGKASTAHASSHEPGGSDPIDWSGKINLRGTLAARPSAASVGAGVLYFATDDNGGTIYRSTGSAWEKCGRGATESGGASVGNEYNPFQTLVSPSASNQALTSSGGTALSIRGGDTESFGATGYSITTTSNGGVSSLRGRYYTMTLPDGGFVCVYLNRPTCGSFSNAVFALMHTYASGASSGFSAFVFNQDNNLLLEGYTSSTANTGPVGTARTVIVPSGYPRVWLGWERQGLDYLPWWSYDGISWTPYGNKVTLGLAADGMFVGTNSYSNTVVATFRSIRVFAAIGPAGGV